MERRRAVQFAALVSLDLVLAACGVKENPVPRPTPILTSPEPVILPTLSEIVLMPEKTPTDIPQAPVSPTATFEPEVWRIDPKDRKLTPIPLPSPTLIKEAAVLRDNFIWRGDKNKPLVAMTFDDGWSGQQIVNFTKILKDTGVRLTVFPAGSAIDAHRQEFKLLYELGGIEFGCHSYIHGDFVTKPVEGMIEEINRSQASLDRALGTHVPYRFFRPPGGAMSWDIVHALAQTKLQGVIWTLSGAGTSAVATPESVRDWILDHAGNGYITLHHFIYNDVAALREMIDGLKAKGLTPTTLSKVL